MVSEDSSTENQDVVSLKFKNKQQMLKKWQGRLGKCSGCLIGLAAVNMFGAATWLATGGMDGQMIPGHTPTGHGPHSGHRKPFSDGHQFDSQQDQKESRHQDKKWQKEYDSRWNDDEEDAWSEFRKDNKHHGKGRGLKHRGDFLGKTEVHHHQSEFDKYGKGGDRKYHDQKDFDKKHQRGGHKMDHDSQGFIDKLFFESTIMRLLASMAVLGAAILGCMTSKHGRSEDSSFSHDYVKHNRFFYFSVYLFVCATGLLYCKMQHDKMIVRTVMNKSDNQHQNGKNKFQNHKKNGWKGKFGDDKFEDEDNFEFEFKHSSRKGRGLSSSDDVWNFVTVNIERGINQVKQLQQPATELLNQAGEQLKSLEEPATQLYDSVEASVTSTYNAVSQPVGEAISSAFSTSAENTKKSSEPVYNQEQISEIIQTEILQGEDALWSAVDAARMSTLIEGLTDWINTNAKVFDTDGLLDQVINPADEFEFVKENEQGESEVIVVKGVQEKKFQLNSSGWMNKGEGQVVEYTTTELPKTSEDWDNLSQEQWEQMFGDQMIKSKSVDLLQFLNKGDVVQIKKWAKEQTLDSCTEFISTFESPEEYAKWCDRINPKIGQLLDMILDQDMIKQAFFNVFSTEMSQNREEILSWLNQATEEEIMQMQIDQTYDGLVEFFQMFETPAQLDAWFKRIDPAQQEIIDMYKTPQSDKISKKAYWTVFGKAISDKIKQDVLIDLMSKSKEEMLKSQHQDTFESLVGFFKLFKTSDELETWYNQIPQATRDFVEKHESQAHKDLVGKAWWTVFEKEVQDKIKKSIIEDANKASEQELMDALDSEDFFKQREFIKMFDSKKSYEKWLHWLKPEVRAICDSHHEHKRREHEILMELFPDEMHKDHWMKKNRQIVKDVKRFNKMTLEEFEEEVSSWERRDVMGSMKKLKNCNDMMEIIDMFDEDKFEVVKEHLGKKFFFKACKKLDSWPHYIKWMASGDQDSEQHPHDFKEHHGKGQGKEHHGHHSNGKGGKGHESQNHKNFQKHDKYQKHENLQHHNRDRMDGKKHGGRGLNSVPFDVRPFEVTAEQRAHLTETFRNGRKLRRGDDHFEGRSGGEERRHQDDGPWFPGKGKQGAHSNSSFLHENRHTMCKIVCLLRFCFLLTIASLTTFLVLFRNTVKHMTELDFLSTVNKHMERQNMDSELRNRSWQMVEQNMNQKTTKNLIVRFVGDLKKQVSYDRRHENWVVVPNPDLVQVEPNTISVQQSTTENLSNNTDNQQPMYTLEQVKQLLDIERGRIAQQQQQQQLGQHQQRVVVQQQQPREESIHIQPPVPPAPAYVPQHQYQSNQMQ